MTGIPVTTDDIEPRRLAARRRWHLVLAVAGIASLPYVTLLAGNVGQELDELHLFAWWAITLLASGAVLAGILMLPERARRWSGAAWVVVLFLLFNLPGAVALRDSIGWEIGDLAAWFVLAGLVLAIAIPLTSFDVVQSFVLVVAPLLLVLPTLEWIVGGSTIDTSIQDPGQSPAPTETFEHTPNIWYFVLDGFASQDFVRERTGHDGSAFAGHLGELGFTVSADAESNYPITILSVGAALELQYVYDGLEEPTGDSWFARLQGHNWTVDTLTANGWSYAHTFPGFWRGSRCSGVEDFCFGTNGPLNDTEVALADLTPLGFLLDQRSSPAVAHANNPAFVVEQVLAAGLPEPTFNFLHLLNPHPPYVRAADCSIRDVKMELSAWGDGSEYGDAVACLERQLTRAVDQILEVDDDPLIVIQGDHGPRFGVTRGLPGGVTYAEDMFFSIFSAVRLPAACDHLEIPADLSPVNTFRIVFACLRDEPVDLLEHVRYPIHRT
ncbi:MAG TPA: sulfatase-like hydrolase/transferase [Nitriliruptorales bacterium]